MALRTVFTSPLPDLHQTLAGLGLALTLHQEGHFGSKRCRIVSRRPYAGDRQSRPGLVVAPRTTPIEQGPGSRNVGLRYCHRLIQAPGREVGRHTRPEDRPSDPPCTVCGTPVIGFSEHPPQPFKGQLLLEVWTLRNPFADRPMFIVGPWGGPHLVEFDQLQPIVEGRSRHLVPRGHQRVAHQLLNHALHPVIHELLSQGLAPACQRSEQDGQVVSPGSVGQMGGPEQPKCSAGIGKPPRNQVIPYAIRPNVSGVEVVEQGAQKLAATICHPTAPEVVQQGKPLFGGVVSGLVEQRAQRRLSNPTVPCGVPDRAVEDCRAHVGFACP